MSVQALIVAAGRGSRSGIGYNKVYYPLNGCCVLSHSIRAMCGSGLFDGVTVVISREDIDLFEENLRRDGTRDLVRAVAFGGSTRQESVYNGPCALPEDTQLVAIHDGARPFVSAEVIRATLESAEACGSGVISTPVIDTIKQIDPETGHVTTPERSHLRAVQTPQSFNYKKLMHAHERARMEDLHVTDDAMLFEHEYGSVHLSCAESAAKNIKLTNPNDFEKLDHQPMMRIGSGYDAHRLKEGCDLILCGEKIEHTRGLDGHSDADVAVHALMDAILGALARGDIGRHFPDNDPKYKGISSMLLLDIVMRTVENCGYKVSNADVTIVAQKPKLAPHIPQMRVNLASAMHIPLDCVNVKATTTERMGFEGEEIGISAQAVVMLAKS
ncbi:MAG: 2-C-methyl-D-erythritol 2,4-cyclodiphosphate synthase [Clostridia bacterium]|nr:2-C-methyl-D-erythritol 2,4-cyclodiphosphate synthase [Clostridia bacterium]